MCRVKLTVQPPCSFIAYFLLSLPGFLIRSYNNHAGTIVNIPGYKIMRKDRVVDTNGGVCIYVRDDMKIRPLSEEHEIIWLYARPNRLLLGLSCLI
jgi:hypothetical protein